MMLIPFVFVLSARFDHYEVFDAITQWSEAWLLCAFIFAILSLRLGFQIKEKPTTIKDQRTNSKAIILITGLLLFGVVLTFLKEVFSFNNFWDLVIVYWIVFMILLFRIIKELIAHYESAARG